MGEFAFRFGDGGPEYTLQNMLHEEGAEEVLRYLFPPYSGGGLTWRIGLSGMRLTDPVNRPNPGLLSRSTETTYADIQSATANWQGGYDADHRALLGLAEETIALTAAKRSGHAVVESGWAEFQNTLKWDHTPDSWYLAQDPPLAPPHHWRGAPWEPAHGYPWSAPAINRDAFRDDPATPQMPHDAIAENEWRLVSLPIEFVYLVTSTDKLLASAGLKAPVLLPPQTPGGKGGSIHVCWRAEAQTLVAGREGGVG